MRFFRTGTGTQNWTLVHNTSLNSGLGTISDNMIQNHYLRPFWRFSAFNRLLNNVAMPTLKIPGDQNIFEKVCYMLKLKVTKFQLLRPNGFFAPPPVQKKVKVTGIRPMAPCA